jgi:TRAP-type uncharacterized transport system substrate-binding protein
MVPNIRRLHRVVLDRLPKHRLLAAAAVLAAVLAVSLCLWNTRPIVYALRISFGTELEYPPEAAALLKDEAAKYGLALDLRPLQSGEDPLHQVANGNLDVAIVRGGARLQHPDLCQIGCFHGQPLHLFVRAKLAAGGLAGLKGRRLNLGPTNVGTHYLAETVLRHLGWRPGAEYQEQNYSSKELLELPPDQFPDAVFCAVKLLSTQGLALAKKYDLRLIEIPLAEVLSIQNHAIEDVSIPAYTYGFEPAVPEKSIHSVAANSLVLVNSRTPKAAIVRWLTVLYESDYARRAGKTPADLAALQRGQEYPLHPGAVEYLHRNDPWFNQQLVDKFTSFRSFLVSAASAMILIWTWYRRRCVERFDQYLQVVSTVEIEAWQSCCRGELDAAARQNSLVQLVDLEIDVLEKHRSGALTDEQQLATFLDRVGHARQWLADISPLERVYRSSAVSDGGEHSKAA